MDKYNERAKKVLQPYLRSFDKYRVDAKDPFEKLWRELAVLVEDVFGNLFFSAGVDVYGKKVSLFNNGNYKDPVSKLIGFNDLPSGKLRDVLDIWTTQNVGLIKDIPVQNIKKLQQVFYAASSDGTPISDIEASIQNILDVSDSRVKLIVDDQIGKLNGNLDRIKQVNSGVDHYFWRSSGDGAVRLQDQRQNGKRYAWDNPPEGGHPGQKVRCRCSAEPDLGGILGKKLSNEAIRKSTFKKAKFLR